MSTATRRTPRPRKTGPLHPGDAFITSCHDWAGAHAVARTYRELIVKKQLHNLVGAYASAMGNGAGVGVWIGRHDGQSLSLTGWEILTRQAS